MLLFRNPYKSAFALAATIYTQVVANSTESNSIEIRKNLVELKDGSLHTERFINASINVMHQYLARNQLDFYYILAMCTDNDYISASQDLLKNENIFCDYESSCDLKSFCEVALSSIYIDNNDRVFFTDPIKNKIDHRQHRLHII